VIDGESEDGDCECDVCRVIVTHQLEELL